MSTCSYTMNLKAEHTKVSKAGQLDQFTYTSSIYGNAECGLTLGHSGPHQSNILVFDREYHNNAKIQIIGDGGLVLVEERNDD